MALDAMASSGIGPSAGNKTGLGSMKVGLGNGGPGSSSKASGSGVSSLMNSDKQDKGPRVGLARPNFRAMKNRDDIQGNAPGKAVPGMMRRAGLKRGTSSAGLSKAIFGGSKRS